MWFRKGWYIGVSNDIEIIVNKRKIKVCHNIAHTLFEYIQKGFVLDDERLKQGETTFGKDYFKELLERVRSIRAS